MNAPFRFLALLLLASLGPHLLADDLYLRVIDVGQGECIVAKATDATGPHYLIYDAGVGHTSAMRGLHAVIPLGSRVDLMVISHNDSDHLGAVKQIMADYHVTRIIHPGDVRDSDTYRHSAAAILHEVATDHCENLDLSKLTIAPGATYALGPATAAFVSGYSRPPADWDIQDIAERNNAGSVFIRVSFHGKSILLCGDAVGRHRNSPPNTCLDAEKVVVERSDIVPIRSDVIVAPHHGANNGSSERFIAAVHPTYVIFSAGHSSNYKHPSKYAAERYLAFGVTLDHMFRTDLGDDEGPEEWDHGRIPHHHDGANDDDIEVKVTDAGVLTVAYKPGDVR